MGEIILILGGARSGKSMYAISLGKKHKKVAFVATCEPKDLEMDERIKLHQKIRPKDWKIFEETKDLASLLIKIGNSFDCIIIDCLTLLVSNLILCGDKEDEILKKVGAMIRNIKKTKAKVILVSNEVGLGVVPINKLGRDFRDIAGKVNQIVTREADAVFFTISGIPTKIKGKG